MCVFFKKNSCCIKSDNQPQNDLGTFDYKTNREIKNVRILLHVGKPQEPLSTYGDFEREKKTS